MGVFILNGEIPPNPPLKKGGINTAFSSPFEGLRGISLSSRKRS